MVKSNRFFYEEVLKYAIEHRNDNPVSIAREAVAFRQDFMMKEEVTLENIQEIVEKVRGVIIMNINTPTGKYPMLVPFSDEKEIQKITKSVDGAYSFVSRDTDRKF